MQGNLAGFENQTHQQARRSGESLSFLWAYIGGARGDKKAQGTQQKQFFCQIEKRCLRLGRIIGAERKAIRSKQPEMGSGLPIGSSQMEKAPHRQ